MKEYSVYTFRLSPMNDEAAELLGYLLMDDGFEGVEQTEDGIKAYRERETSRGFDPNVLMKSGVFNDIEVSCHEEKLTDEDWNLIWETEGFTPIVIDGICTIRRPDQKVDGPKTKYEILIRPRMAFGSGTHETTRMLVRWILTHSFDGQRCLDMGCGTGILAICLSKRGAGKVMAIDVDPASVENSRKNALLNEVNQIEIIEGNADSIEDSYNFIVANIHRNIIVNDLPAYVRHLSDGGRLAVSGFFVDDEPIVQHAAENCGLTLLEELNENGWSAMLFGKL